MKDKEIYIRVTTINGHTRTEYSVDREDWHESFSVLLKNLFSCHGELYAVVYGIPYSESSLAKWDPDGHNFTSDGWRRFLRDKGRIEKKEVIYIDTLTNMIAAEMEEEAKRKW